MSIRVPASHQHPISSRPNLEELAAILRARKDRSGEHTRPDKTSSGIRKKSVSNKNESHVQLDDCKKLRTQVESMLSRRAPADDSNSAVKVDKSAKRPTAGNYFLTADVSNVLRAINLNAEATMNRRTIDRREFTEEDVDRLFSGSQNKNRKSDKENDSGLNFRPELKKELLTSKASIGRAKKKEMNTEADVELEVVKQQTMKAGDLGKLIADDEVEVMKPTMAERANKDFAESVRFLQLEEEPDRLLNGLTPLDLAKIEDDPSIDKTSKFKADFLVGKQIGEGAYASVRVAVFRPSSQKVAIKIYEKRKIREPPRKKSVRREVKILQRLEHPNVVRIMDVVETNNHVNLVMEYVSGVSLASFLKGQPNGRVNEKEARKIFKPLIDGIAYLHSQSVSHRDIKLENVLLDGRLNPKLIDFGFATCTVDRVKLFCGTPSYMAPEIVLKTQYRGEPADVWALGVLLYVVLTGIFPFKGQTDKELYKKIVTSDYPAMEGASHQAVTLISQMLTVDIDRRITAAQVLQHDWITGQTTKNRSESAALKRQLNKKVSESTPKHCYELLENLVKRSSERPDANKPQKRQTEKILAQTQKQNLRQQLRLAQYEGGSANCSPKASLPNTCTNRNTLAAKLQSELLAIRPPPPQSKKKSQERLNNKRYF